MSSKTLEKQTIAFLPLWIQGTAVSNFGETVSTSPSIILDQTKFPDVQSFCHPERRLLWNHWIIISHRNPVQALAAV